MALLGCDAHGVGLVFSAAIVLVRLIPQFRMRDVRTFAALQEEQVADRLVLDAVHHVLEQHVRLFLVFDERILLAVAAQPDAFLQVIHRQQVILPLVVDDVEHDHAFGFAQQRRAEHVFFFLILLVEELQNIRFGLIAMQVHQIFRGDLDAELSEHVSFKPRPIVGAGMSFFGQPGIDERTQNAFDDFADACLLIITFDQAAAHAVHRLALLVHYVVVFDDVFAGSEVLRFDGLLGGRDSLGDHLALDRHIFFHAEPQHQVLHALAAKDAHQIILQRQVKASRPGITLPSRSPTKLIIDTPRIVPFRA